MQLRFQIPITILLTAPTRDQLDLPDGSFRQETVNVHFRLKGSDPMEIATLPASQRYVRHCQALEFELTTDDEAAMSKSLAAQNWDALAPALASIANRVLLGIRNFGIVAHTSEVKLGQQQAESILRVWKVEVTDSPGNFQPVFPTQPESLFASLLGRGIGPAGELEAFRWLDILEAVELDLEPGPHQEFATNSVEHVRLGNLRYALIEAAICLELTISRFLWLYLERKGFSRSRIESFLNPQLGLTARVAVVLELAVSRNEIGDVTPVLRAISWRNALIHGHGHLPEGVGDQEVIASIVAVLGLAGFVATKFDELRNSEEMLRVSKQIGQEFGVSLFQPAPLIRTGAGMHTFLADFHYFAEEQLPNRETMERLVTRVTELLVDRDPRFEPDRHLMVRFMVFPNTVKTRWFGGRFTPAPPSANAV